VAKIYLKNYHEHLDIDPELYPKICASKSPRCGGQRLSTNVSRAAERYAQSHSFLVTPCCIDTAKALHHDAFLVMIRRLLYLRPIAIQATARAFPTAQGAEAGSDEDDSNRAAAAACENAETDAVGTYKAAGRRTPLMH
jgi:hypothetical protein